MEKVKINEFVPIWGDFSIKDKTLIYKGSGKPTDTSSGLVGGWLTGGLSTPTKPGLILFPVSFKDGKIKVKVKFDDVDFFTFCGIIYDYFPLINSVNFQYAGISNAEGYFCRSMTPNGAVLNFGVGTSNSLQSGKEYIIEVEIIGNYLQLSVNGVVVGNGAVGTKQFGTNIGLFVQNTGNIQISSVETNYQNPKVFVVMQFSHDYKAIYEDVIKAICLERDLDVIRGDESYDTGMIISDIIKRIEESSLIIADITPDNPNVFYEVGYAHALKKPTILMSDKTREKLPFDVSGFRTIFYDNKIGGKKVVEETLRKFLDEMNIGNIIK